MKLFHTALVLGKGGFGTQLGEMLEEASGYSRILYLDDQAPDAAGKLADYLDPAIRERCTAAFVGLGNNELRLQWLQKLVAAGYQTPVFEHPAAEVCSSAALGAGTVVLPFAFVGAGTKVGAGCIINAQRAGPPLCRVRPRRHHWPPGCDGKGHHRLYEKLTLGEVSGMAHCNPLTR